MLPGLALNDITTDDITRFYNDKAVVHILRLDKISPVISGNKWFKLRYYLDEAKAMRKKGILTFGGAWSNHIIATAAACNMMGLQSIGIIRGEEAPQISPTLNLARNYGMQLIFISRTAFQNKEIPSALPLNDYMIVNEGGYGEIGARGASTILDHCENSYTHYCCAAGTGTMVAGIINRLSSGTNITGISVLKNNRDIDGMVQAIVFENKSNWQILHDYAFGGYAKHTPALLKFMNEFYRQTNIPSDFVYTGKLFFAITDMIEKNYFPKGSKILVIHSGGLQGNASLPAGTLMF